MNDHKLLTNTDLPSSPINVTEKARKKLASILDQQNDTPFMRIAIKGGGCAGFSHEFTLEAAPEEGDQVLTWDDVRGGLIVDPVSLQYLTGSTFDYRETLTESKFALTIPGSKGHCGCGESFSL